MNAVRCIGIVALLVRAATANAEPGPDVPPSAAVLLAEMHGTYASLSSYADEGRIIAENKVVGGPMVVETHRFVTRFTTPRKFYFDFQEDAAAGADRYVIWCPGETFSFWWSATGVAEHYKAGQGATAFAVGVTPTVGAALLIPPLLFPQAQLGGPLLSMEEAQYAGTEKIDGRLHFVLTAPVRVNYWSQQTRKTTLWLDVKTHVVRKVVEDTPTGHGEGVVLRLTTTINPQLNPVIDEMSFQFANP